MGQKDRACKARECVAYTWMIFRSTLPQNLGYRVPRLYEDALSIGRPANYKSFRPRLRSDSFGCIRLPTLPEEDNKER